MKLSIPIFFESKLKISSKTLDYMPSGNRALDLKYIRILNIICLIDSNLLNPA